MGGFIGRLTAAGVLKNSPMKGVVAFLQDTHSVFTCGLAGDQRMRSAERRMMIILTTSFVTCCARKGFPANLSQPPALCCATATIARNLAEPAFQASSIVALHGNN
jgi:hypothetical protein